MIRFPWLRRLFKPPPYHQTRPSNRERFETVFTTGRWVVGGSVSGPGSDKDSGSVRHALDVLEKVCREHDIRSIADVPCGDFNWMGDFLDRHPDIDYVGYDIVAPLIELNRAAHPNRRFEILDIAAEIPPPADLIFCKDLVNHLFERDVWATLAHLAASGSRLVMITSNAGYPNQELYMKGPGASRELNLATAPYSLPEPVYADHYLSMWTREAILARLTEREF